MKIQRLEKNPISYKTDVAPKSPSFRGIGDSFLSMATKGLELCDKYPMVGVAFTDSVATDIPRTVMDLKTGIPAAMETMRREFSGLIVNCLMPSFIVLGVSKAINKPVMGKDFKSVDMSASWADGATLSKFVEHFKGAKKSFDTPTTREEMSSFVKNTLHNLEGLDKDNWIRFKDRMTGDKAKEAVDIITEAIFDDSGNKKVAKEAVLKANELISSQTHATQNLRFAGEKQFASSLSEILRDQIDIGKKFRNIEVAKNVDAFKKHATKLVNSKSLAGMAIIVPIAMSMQTINRAITRHKYNKKGAPIYKDFEKGDTHRELTPTEKAKFFGQKMMCSGAMLSLALLSMMKKPTLSMFQFKGMFPTVDQCRWIATSTIISRILASEDPNELRESTVRDMASFAGLYFLGDYAAKTAATVIEKINPDTKLLNRNFVKEQSESFFKKAGNWIKRTSVKSFDEVLPSAKNMRSLCEIASLGFSIISLGIVLPAYNRHVTNKKVEAQKALEIKAKLDDNSRLIVELRGDKYLNKDGIFHIVAQDCFK